MRRDLRDGGMVGFEIVPFAGKHESALCRLGILHQPFGNQKIIENIACVIDLVLGTLLLVQLPPRHKNTRHQYQHQDAKAREYAERLQKDAPHITSKPLKSTGMPPLFSYLNSVFVSRLRDFKGGCRGRLASSCCSSVLLPPGANNVGGVAPLPL